MDPITLDSLDVTDTKATVESHASSVEHNTFATAQAHVVEASSLYLTADEYNTFAYSTLKEDL